MRRLRRHLVGFVHRVVFATLLAMAGWYSCVVPPDTAWQASLQRVVCYGLTYVPAVIGQLTYPLGGMDLFFARGSTWCDFCSPQEVFWHHLRFVVPVYVLLFYVPMLLQLVARRDRHLFERILIGSAIYVVMATTFFTVTSGNDRRGDIRTAAVWFMILAAASAIGWSKLAEKWKAVGIAVVVLLGAWALSLLMMLVAPKADGIHVGYYVANLFLLVVGVTFLLGATWMVEYILSRLRERRVADA